MINALLTGGDITLRASDREDTSTDPQTRIELSIIGTDEERLRALFDGLAEGGTVRTQLERQFWGDIFGAVTDKYGELARRASRRAQPCPVARPGCRHGR